MKLITNEIKDKLIKNIDLPEEKRKPWLKLFTPFGSATWLITEYIDGEGDNIMLFGLCDLGMGSPELGYVSLNEIEELNTGPLPKIERDKYWSPEHNINHYYTVARSEGGINV